jgi:hypothetical protein
MDQDRRTSLRRKDKLPFAWCLCEAEPKLTDICQGLDLPLVALSNNRLSDLESEANQTISGIRDTAVASALALMNRRVSLLQEALLGSLQIPAPVALDLSAEGLGFRNAVALASGSWLGIHLVLPDGSHLICAGHVNHCHPDGDEYAVGVSLAQLDEAASRRLTRYVISSKSLLSSD